MSEERMTEDKMALIEILCYFLGQDGFQFFS